MDYVWLLLAGALIFLLLERRESRYWRRQYEREFKNACNHFDAYTRAVLAAHDSKPRRKAQRAGRGAK